MIKQEKWTSINFIELMSSDEIDFGQPLNSWLSNAVKNFKQVLDCEIVKGNNLRQMIMKQRKEA